jgi:hypothetical protein
MRTQLTPAMQQVLQFAGNSAPEARMIGGYWMRSANRLVQQGFCTLHRLNERRRYYEIRLTEAGATALVQMMERDEREEM